MTGLATAFVVLGVASISAGTTILTYMCLWRHFMATPEGTKTIHPKSKRCLWKFKESFQNGVVQVFEFKANDATLPLVQQQ